MNVTVAPTADTGDEITGTGACVVAGELFSWHPVPIAVKAQTSTASGFDVIGYLTC